MSKRNVVFTGTLYGKFQQFILELDFAEIQIAFYPDSDSRNSKIAAMILLPVHFELPCFFRDSTQMRNWR